MPLRHMPNQEYRQPIALFTPKQVYAMEKIWFEKGNISYSLMQQAAWQIAHWVNQNIVARAYLQLDEKGRPYIAENTALTACVWVGSGNNGGDGWLVPII